MSKELYESLCIMDERQEEKKRIVARALFENYPLGRRRFFEIGKEKYEESKDDPTATIISDYDGYFILKKEIGSEVEKMSLMDIVLLVETFSNSKQVRTIKKWVKFMGWIFIISIIVSFLLFVLLDDPSQTMWYF